MTLIEAVRTTIRRLHYSPRTEEAYLHWIRAFIGFHGGRHPREMGAPEATAFLNYLAVHRRVSASTQNQALCALVFFCTGASSAWRCPLWKAWSAHIDLSTCRLCSRAGM